MARKFLFRRAMARLASIRAWAGRDDIEVSAL
jgi:hypothetical protein